MMFKSLTVENFGAFSSKNSFDLSVSTISEKSQPIIIFGGKNGTGKTTLLEAIKICLYGNCFRGRRMPKRAYHKYLRQHLHRDIDGMTPSEASISVEFDYARSGYVDDYLIRRSWKFTASEIMETLEIKENNEPLQEVYEEQWQDFLMELIPPGLSKLFFFDGEQIQSLAKGEGENKYILNSINSLLGIDLVEHLQHDLKIYFLRKTAGKGSNVASTVEELRKKMKSLEESYESVLQKKASLQTKIGRVNAEIEEQERTISMEGGGFASKREQLRVEEKKLEEAIEVLKEEIRSLCANLLPFAFVPELCIALRSRLQQEEKEQQRVATIVFLRDALENLIGDLDKTDYMSSLPLSQNQKHAITLETVNELRNRIEKMNGACKEIVHPISSLERNEILRWIDTSLTQIPSRLLELSTRLKRLENEKERVEDFLFRAPSDDVLRPLFVKLGKLHEELGMLQQQQSVVAEEVRRTRNELNEMSRELSKVLEEKSHFDKISGRLKLAARTQEVLGEYLQRLRREKIKEFAQNFLDCFNLLFSKKDLIQEVSVDPDSFDVTLISGRGVVIPKAELSAGEKQIYAIALLWALARTSGRRLPFIIDTPLARLDTEHRTNMMRSFLPNASHQVIVFSTNTEIDRAYFGQMQPYISRAYQLEYDGEHGLTCAQEGYFWRTGKEILVNELQ